MVNKITSDSLLTMLTLVTNVPMGTLGSTVTMIISIYYSLLLCKYVVSVLHRGHFLTFFIISKTSDCISGTPFTEVTTP